MGKKCEPDSPKENNRMANTYIKKCSPLLVIREMEIRSTMHTTTDLPAQQQLKMTLTEVTHLGNVWNHGALTSCWECGAVLPSSKLFVFNEGEHANTPWLTISLLSYYIDNIGVRDARDIRLIFCDSVHIKFEDQSSSQGSGCLWGGGASAEG